MDRRNFLKIGLIASATAAASRLPLSNFLSATQEQESLAVIKDAFGKLAISTENIRRDTVAAKFCAYDLKRMDPAFLDTLAGKERILKSTARLVERADILSEVEAVQKASGLLQPHAADLERLVTQRKVLFTELFPDASVGFNTLDSETVLDLVKRNLAHDAAASPYHYDEEIKNVIEATNKLFKTNLRNMKELKEKLASIRKEVEAERTNTSDPNACSYGDESIAVSEKSFEQTGEKPQPFVQDVERVEDHKYRAPDELIR